MTHMQAARTDNTPQVIFDPVSNTLHLEGECYPENPSLFFHPVITSVHAHVERNRPHRFNARIRLFYVNSASTKSMRQLFVILNDAAKAGCSVDIDWEYDEDDDAIQDLGEDLMYGLGIPYVNFNETPFVS